MKIVSFKICPFVQRVTALLEAKNVPYDIDYIDLSNKPKWFLDVSPNAQVPILITDDNRVLFESDAIVEYIDEVAGAPMLSGDPVTRAQDRAWSYLAAKNYLVQCSSQRSADEPTHEERLAKLKTAFTKIEKRLSEGGTFAHDDQMSAVDIAWLPILHRTDIIKEYSGFDYLENYPSLQKWRAAIMATGIPEKSVPEDFEERFTAFYLPDTTFLGRLTREKNGEACCGDAQCHAEDMACCA